MITHSLLHMAEARGCFIEVLQIVRMSQGLAARSSLLFSSRHRMVCPCMQVANSWGQGVDKRSFEERKAFVQEHLELILDSAERPFDGHRYAGSLPCSALSNVLRIVQTTCEAIWQPAFFPSPPLASPLLLQPRHFCFLCIPLRPCSGQIDSFFVRLPVLQVVAVC